MKEEPPTRFRVGGSILSVVMLAIHAVKIGQIACSNS
jgi:hypothetical protein